MRKHGSPRIWAFGYAVIVPEASVQIAGMPAVGWWRVHPLGGETLGRMQSGEGQAMSEYVTNFVKQQIILSPLTLPGMISGAQSYRCKQAGRTDGWCDPCFLAGTGLIGAGLGIYAGINFKGWFGASAAIAMGTYSVTTNFLACTDFVMTAGRHGTYVTQSGGDSDSQ